jgi:hypothetical protein
MKTITDLRLDIIQLEQALAKIKKAIENARPESIKVEVKRDTLAQIQIIYAYAQRCVDDMQRLFEQK